MALEKLRGVFHPSGSMVSPGQKPPLGMRVNKPIIRIGMVEKINVDKQTVHVDMFDGSGIKYDCSITQPYAGTASFIAGMPEEGAIVILVEDEDNCYIISYLPNYYSSLESKHIKRWPENIRNTATNDFVYNFKKLRAGEIALGSSEGSEVFLNHNVLLEDSFGDNLLLKSDEHSLMSTSLNNFAFSSGVWRNAGIIRRDSLGISEASDSEYAVREILKDGKVIFPFRPAQTSDFEKYFTEYHIEVEDQGQTTLPVNDVNSERNAIRRMPVAIFALGNFVGNNEAKRTTYGKMLRVKLFNSPDDNDGAFRLRPVTGADADNLGMAISLYSPNRRNYDRGAYIGIDKEGHYFQFLPSASGGGIGKGRSMSVLALGNKKEVWGQDTNAGNSWDMTLSGGLKWRIGHHSDRDKDLKGKSIDIRVTKLAYFDFGGELGDSIKDFDTESSIIDPVSYRKIEKVSGNERLETSGSRESIVGGSEKLKIDGMREEKIKGAMSIAVGGASNLVVGDTYAVKVTKEKQETFGSRVTTITSGSSELVMDPKPNPAARGNISEIIKVRGNRTTSIRSGNIEESIQVRGDRSFTTTTGDYSANIRTRGNMTLNTNNGNIILNTRTGEVEIQGTRKVFIKTLGGVELKGSKVDIKGSGPLLSGIVTNKSHLDYITGAALQASKTVKATL